MRQNLIKLFKAMPALALTALFLNSVFGQKVPVPLKLQPIDNIKDFNFKTIFNSKTSPYFLRVSYGDVTGDQAEEAIILLRESSTGRGRPLDKVFIYSLINRKVVKIDGFNAGHRGDYVLSINSLGSNFKVEDRILVLDLAILRQGEDVPTNYYTIKYRWNGIQMEEIERSSLKPLPDQMREVG